jgi:hypothetical protein
LSAEWNESKVIATQLRGDAAVNLRAVADDLTRVVGPLAPTGRTYSFFVDEEPSDGERTHWYRFQLIATARELGYFFNPSIFHTWTRLILEAEGRSEILISFHGIGHQYRGLLVASACYFRRDITGEHERNVTDITPLSEEAFQINYREQSSALRERFQRWLDPVLVTGFEIFRRGL